MLRPPSIPGSHDLLVSIREKDNEPLFVFNLTLEPQDFALPARIEILPADCDAGVEVTVEEGVREDRHGGGVRYRPNGAFFCQARDERGLQVGILVHI
jgi:hypothetical protein